jgi:hypothetical protein
LGDNLYEKKEGIPLPFYVLLTEQFLGKGNYINDSTRNIDLPTKIDISY